MRHIDRRLVRGGGAGLAALLLVGLMVGGASAAGTGTGVYTVGGDSFGQLGNGSAGASYRPEQSSVLPVGVSATDVAGGREHALALDSNHAVWAWGSDAKGQIGDGTPLVNKPSPVKVLSGAKAVTTGHYHSMALMSDGSVRAWGWNSRGQTGRSSGTTVPAPVSVTLPDPATEVAAGRAHSLAIVDGDVYAWGDDTFGQLGIGKADTAKHPTPTKVAGLPSGTFTSVAGGRDTSFAISTTGDLWAWGDNTYGQLGASLKGPVVTPQKVMTGVSDVESGADHTIALRGSDHTVWTWGRNEYGQLGYSGGSVSTPHQVKALSTISQVFAGRDHCIAIGSDGSVYTWGRNDGGQLGVDPATLAKTSVPQRIAAFTGAVDAGGGQVFSVLLR